VKGHGTVDDMMSTMDFCLWGDEIWLAISLRLVLVRVL